MDFFSLCEANAPSVKLKYNELASNFKGGDKVALELFCQRVRDEGVITINMRPIALLNFLVKGRLVNIYELAEKLASYSKTKSKDEIVEEKLGKYYEKRKAFDKYFAEVDELRYGALNIGGGLGSTRYGEYCVVFTTEVITKEGKLGYLSADSLNQFVSSSFEVDEEGIKNNCATDSCKHFLATLKHSSELIKITSGIWAKMLCNDDNYIEAIFSLDIKQQHIFSVRMSKLDYDLYWEYAFEEHREKLNELDRYRIDSFIMIYELLEGLKLNSEIIEDD